jgi:hypothetical protein
LAAAPLQAATTTSKYTVDNTAWTDLGSGPLLLSFKGDGVYAIGDTAPTLPVTQGFTVPAGATSKIKSTSHVWAMARGAASVLAYVGGVNVGPGNGGGTTTPTSVWSAADAAANGMTLSNGGLTVTAPVSGAVWNSVRATVSHAVGKFSIEFLLNSGDNYYVSMGLADAGFNPVGDFLGNAAYSFGENTNYGSVAKAGFTGLSTSTLKVNAVPGDVMSLAVDFDAGKAWIAYNNVWSDAGSPSAGTNPLITGFFPAVVGLPLFPALGIRPQTQTTAWTLHSTAASQKYAAPAGFSPWN